jgi:hypothetical protein
MQRERECVCVCLCVCVQYYEIILICFITLIGNNLIAILPRNITFLICLPLFYSTDPFLRSKIPLGKGM